MDGQDVPCDEIKNRLNEALVSGIAVSEVYEGGRKYRDLSLLSCEIVFSYDSAVQEDAVGEIGALFANDSIVLLKKTKSGMQEQDIIPMIRRVVFTQKDEHTIVADVLICCQNPTLNPAQIPLAISTFLPAAVPSDWRCRRLEIFDSKEEVFR